MKCIVVHFIASHTQTDFIEIQNEVFMAQKNEKFDQNWFISEEHIGKWRNLELQYVYYNIRLII